MTATAGFVLGLSGVSYYNTGTYASPAWVVIDQVGDVEIPIEFDESDATTRAGGGFEQILPSIAKSTISVDQKYCTGNTAWQALQTACLTRALTEFLFLDGPIVHATGMVNSQGLRLSCYITKFGLTQKLKEIMANPLTLRPGPSANPPAWYTSAT